jgi:predicted nucleotidyltransferase
MSAAITLDGALAEQLQREAQAQETTVEELLGYLLQLARSEGRRREALAEIKQIGEQIAREFKPEKIILFGSYAYGIPREGSDIDLLVIMPFEGRHREQAVKIHAALDQLLPLDLMVRRPEEIAERIKLGDSFIREIVERGKVLYEAKHNGLDSKGRGRLGVRAARSASAQKPKL